MGNMVSRAYDDVVHGSPDLSWAERGISIALGLAVAAAGARPRPNPMLNVLALGVGSYLAYRGATGHCPVKAALTGGESRRRIAAAH